MPHHLRARTGRYWALIAGGVLLVVALVLMYAQRDDDAGSAPPPTPASSSPSDLPGSDPSSGPTETPEPGSLDPVPVREVETAPPVGLAETGDFGTGLTLRIRNWQPVEGVARGPGEIAGPAVRLVLEAHNDTGRPVSLEGVVVALEHGPDHTPAITLSEPDADPFEGELAAGGTARAAYVFAVPEEERDRVRVSASYTGAAPTLVFQGALR